jgi:hypothetical protein
MGQAGSLLTTVSSSTNLVLTRESARKHRITGSIAQRILLPPTTNLMPGDEYVVFNQSTQVVTVANSGNTTITTIAAGLTERFTVADITGNGIWMTG